MMLLHATMLRHDAAAPFFAYVMLLAIDLFSPLLPLPLPLFDDGRADIFAAA